MLVLTIDKAETITIFTSDGEVIVTNVETKGKAAKLGFTAPTKIRIFRTELLGKVDGGH